MTLNRTKGVMDWKIIGFLNESIMKSLSQGQCRITPATIIDFLFREHPTIRKVRYIITVQANP